MYTGTGTNELFVCNINIGISICKNISITLIIFYLFAFFQNQGNNDNIYYLDVTDPSYTYLSVKVVKKQTVIGQALLMILSV